MKEKKSNGYGPYQVKETLNKYQERGASLLAAIQAPY
jgi:hypothetical protein